MMDFRDWQGKAVLDRDGHKVGNIGQLYVDDSNNAPAWATVRTNDGENFFPVSMAHVQGEDIIIDVPENDLKQAPRIEADEQIDTDDEMELYNYYRQKWGDNSSDDKQSSSMQDDDSDNMDDTQASSGDDEHQQVHLRRYTVTEMVTDDGEVQRKEVIIEREPMEDDDMQASGDMDKQDGTDKRKDDMAF